MDEGIPLLEVVDALRTEILAGMEGATGEALRFAVDSVEVELEVAVTKGVEAGAKAKFWVLEAGAKTALERTRTQKVRLKLTPKARDAGSGAPREVLLKG